MKSILRWNLFVALLATMGVICKPILSPAVNLLTDLLFIPGGSTLTGFSMSFLLVGALMVPGRYTATKIGFLQGVLALLLGVSGFQGFFVLLSYTLPGVVVDAVLSSPFTQRLEESSILALAQILAVLTGALLTNTAFFHLKPLPFALFLALGALSALGGSRLAYHLVQRLRPILPTLEESL